MDGAQYSPTHLVVLLHSLGPGYVHNIALTGVEGHAPSVQAVKVVLQYSLVPRIVNGSVNKTVVGEEACALYMRDLLVNVISI